MNKRHVLAPAYMSFLIYFWNSLTELQNICICCIISIPGKTLCNILKPTRAAAVVLGASFCTFLVALDQRVWWLRLGSPRRLVVRFRMMLKTGELLGVWAGLPQLPNSDQQESTRAKMKVLIKIHFKQCLKSPTQNVAVSKLFLKWSPQRHCRSRSHFSPLWRL